MAPARRPHAAARRRARGPDHLHRTLGKGGTSVYAAYVWQHRVRRCARGFAARARGAAARSSRPGAAGAGASAFAFGFSGGHGRIGVVVRTEASTETDKVGAKLEGVTPGGPAEKAGLKVGDIITRFNGTGLAGATTEDEEESGPGLKLIRLAHTLEPGDTVRLEYRRGNETKPATLVAADLGGVRYELMPGPLVTRSAPMVHLPGMDFNFDTWFGAPWGDLSLVSLNAELGEYFGVKEGVLVVKAPGDSTLALKGGDVILSIGGRTPGSPSHAMRILRSYDRGETVSIEIMRRQKRMTLTWKVPAGGRRVRVYPRGDDTDEHDEESGLWRVQPTRPAHGRAV
ncbi:MAG TPA: PDZ domain-containing protein [Gemmatimonadales bacterium]|nr:PDZ domain-containing protein [Gemmatimonadales bacterium]